MTSRRAGGNVGGRTREGATEVEVEAFNGSNTSTSSSSLRGSIRRGFLALVLSAAAVV